MWPQVPDCENHAGMAGGGPRDPSGGRSDKKLGPAKNEERLVRRPPARPRWMMRWHENQAGGSGSRHGALLGSVR